MPPQAALAHPPVQASEKGTGNLPAHLPLGETFQGDMDCVPQSSQRASLAEEMDSKMNRIRFDRNVLGLKA